MKTAGRGVVRSCRLTPVLIVVVGLAWAGSVQAALQDFGRRMGREPSASETPPREPAIDSGFLIVENRYVAPPNPFGASLSSQPAVLLGLKLSVTAACVAVLWNLRFYHGTQLASWWLCLGLTLLTARWVVFNSLMLA